MRAKGKIDKTKHEKSGVLFLDIDGVLCTDRAYYASGQDKVKSIMRTYDPVSIQLVDRICQDFNLEVVISSTWRKMYDVPLILLTHGFKSSFHRDEQTAQKMSSNRAEEISMWLTDHPEIDRFIIFDDIESGYSIDNHENLKKNWVETDYSNGVTTRNYLEARHILSQYE